jgi:membrane protein YqaA with SNARE-associated domain
MEWTAAIAVALCGAMLGAVVGFVICAMMFAARDSDVGDEDDDRR